MALLRALAVLAPRRNWRLNLGVAHVQHHLRPATQAEGDARFVAELAGRLELPFLRVDLVPPSAPGRAGNREGWARRERYVALGEMERWVPAAAACSSSFWWKDCCCRSPEDWVD